VLDAPSLSVRKHQEVAMCSPSFPSAESDPVHPSHARDMLYMLLYHVNTIINYHSYFLVTLLASDYNVLGSSRGVHVVCVPWWIRNTQPGWFMVEN